MIESAIACAAVLVAFALARRLSDRFGHPPLLSPVLVASLMVAGGLALLHVPVAQFEAAAWPLRWLLGPALVALATVIAGNAAMLKGRLPAVLGAVGGGTAFGIGTAVAMARMLGLAPDLRQALAVKTVTSPFAIVIMRSLAGPVALAAALAVLTGVIGALTVIPLLGRLGIEDPITKGLATGVSSHIVGTEALASRDARAGAASALAMVLTGLFAALLLPLAWAAT